MKKLRGGLCGLGFMGRTHLSAYAPIPGVELTAICCASAKRFKATTQGNIKQSGEGDALLRKIRRYDTLPEMLKAEKLDFVDICTPTFTHVEMACQALKSGVHVLCEKPMALSVAGCDQMIRAAQKSRRFIMTAHVLRWWPEYVFLHDAMLTGCYGKLKSLYLFRGSMPTSWAPWMSDEEKSGGPLLDLHIHDVDQILWLLGKPLGLTASLSKDRRAGAALFVYPHVEATVEFNSNLKGGFAFNMAYRAQFERATLVFDFSQKQPLTLWAGGKQSFPQLPKTDAYGAEIRYFVSCIRKGRAPARVTPQEARNGIALALLERKAALSKKWLRASF